MEQPANEAPEPAPQTWMPIAGGILSIVAGSLGLIAIAFLITFGATFGADIAREVLDSVGFWDIGAPLAILSLMAIPFIIINAVAIIGGIYATIKEARARRVTHKREARELVKVTRQK